MNQAALEPVKYPGPRSPLCYGSLQLPSRWLLSPLAGYTNLSFRRVLRELGGLGLATTDLINAKGLLNGNRKSLQLAESCPEDTPYSVQIFGSEPAALCDAARLLEERGADSVDINMGCPVDRITKGGAGASMMCSADRTLSLVRSVVESVRIPVTVKMRLGWDDSQITAPRFAREFEQVGVAAIAIHGRTRAQGFRGSVSLDGIRQVVEAVDSVPVIGNGDVRSIPDAARMLQTTGCTGVSIGRGALANPWIFRQLAEWEATGRWSPSGSFEERLALLWRQFQYLQQQIGIEHAILTFRRTAHWYLKHMRVRSRLRHTFQQASTYEEVEAALRAVSAAGPCEGTRNGELPELTISVPSGPVERW
ncbi:MAG: tRNA dihydrouridine synthase DusB [Planctomycetaceae bacterium]|nr:tRNA dihydrouridine synthase DusB [Planctomycetaceae bacterium]